MPSSPEVSIDKIHPEALTDGQLVTIHRFVHYGVVDANEIRFLERLVTSEKALGEALPTLREKAVRGIDALLAAKQALEASSADTYAPAAKAFRRLCPRAFEL